MTTYHYKARDKFGKLISGAMGADSEKAVATKLEQMEYLPITIQAAKGAPQIGKFFDRFKGIKFSDLNIFTRELFVLQRAGLALLSSLRALQEQAPNPIFKNVLGQVIRDIEAGSTLSDALARHPRIFNSLYVSMVKSGEVSGRLDETLDRLATLGEHDEQIRMRIQAAMMYPSIVVVGLIVGFLILVTMVIPRFANVYSRFDSALPLPTQFLIGVNYVITHFWWMIILVICGLIVLWQQFVKTSNGMLWRDSLRLKVPVFGPLVFKMIMSRFCRATGILMRSGVPILQILELVSDGVGNIVISRAIQKIKESVKEGKGMSAPMKDSGLFPPIVVQMVSAGESTGKVDELLLHASDYFDLQIDHTIRNLVSLVEPILIVILGLVVLVMALGIFLPMWNLMHLFKR
ncbi:MAG: type II secretion system F family protein [Candidatus Omnitrophota bacterium]